MCAEIILDGGGWLFLVAVFRVDVFGNCSERTATKATFGYQTVASVGNHVRETLTHGNVWRRVVVTKLQEPSMVCSVFFV